MANDALMVLSRKWRELEIFHEVLPHFSPCSQYEINAMRLGPGKHLHGRTLAEGIVKPEEFDYLHELVINQELVRHGQRGYGDGLLAGMVIGLPPVLNFGSDELKA